MYEGVHAHPDGEATVARHALTAGEYGYDGIVVRNHGDRQTDYDPATVAAETGVDVVDGIELRSDDRAQLSGLVSQYRDDRTILAVHGGDDDINRFACEEPMVDVLAHPMADEGDVNHVLAKAAKQNHVHVEFDFSPVFTTDGGTRVQALRDLRKLRDIVSYYDTPYVVSLNPDSHLALRAPREVVAVAGEAGFDSAGTRGGLPAGGRLARRHRDRRPPSFIGAGGGLGGGGAAAAPPPPTEPGGRGEARAGGSRTASGAPSPRGRFTSDRRPSQQSAKTTSRKATCWPSRASGRFRLSNTRGRRYQCATRYRSRTSRPSLPSRRSESTSPSRSRRPARPAVRWRHWRA